MYTAARTQKRNFFEASKLLRHFQKCIIMKNADSEKMRKND